MNHGRIDLPVMIGKQYIFIVRLLWNFGYGRQELFRGFDSQYRPCQ